MDARSWVWLGHLDAEVLRQNLARSNSKRSFEPVFATFTYAICNNLSVGLV